MDRGKNLRSGERLRLDENVPYLGMASTDRRFHSIDRLTDLLGRELRLEFDVERQQHIMWSEVHCQRLPDFLNCVVLRRDRTHARQRLRIDPFSDQQTLSFVSQKD